MWNLTSEVLTSSLEKVGHHHRSRILFDLMPRSLMKFVRVHINNMAMQNLANVKQPKPSFSCRVRFHGVGWADFLYQGNARSAAFLKRKPTLNMDMSSTVQMGHRWTLRVSGDPCELSPRTLLYFLWKHESHFKQWVSLKLRIQPVCFAVAPTIDELCHLSQLSVFRFDRIASPTVIATRLPKQLRLGIQWQWMECPFFGGASQTSGHKVQ